jgi:hypothetical protein
MFKVQVSLNQWDGKKWYCQKQDLVCETKKNGVRLKLLNVRKITLIYFHFQKTTDGEKMVKNTFQKSSQSGNFNQKYYLAFIFH